MSTRYKLPVEKLLEITNQTYFFRHLIKFLCFILLKLSPKKIFLVIGMSRSGTTLLGNIISMNEDSLYLHEPIKMILLKKYSLANKQLDNYEDFWKNYAFSKKMLEYKKHAFYIMLFHLIFQSKSNIRNIIIKPISLIDCFHDITNYLDLPVIIITRHPCGRSESILRQKEYDGVNVFSQDILFNLGSEWGSSTKRLLYFSEKNYKCIIIKFEDLCLKPIEKSRNIYDKLGLSWSIDIENKIMKITTTDSKEFYGINRISHKQVDKWEQTLDKNQIELIRKGTLPFETNLYKGF